MNPSFVVGETVRIRMYSVTKQTIFCGRGKVLASYNKGEVYWVKLIPSEYDKDSAWFPLFDFPQTIKQNEISKLEEEET